MPKTRALKLEQDIIEDLGGSSHANSGAMKKKFDGSTESFVLEVKTTEKSSFSVKDAYFDELKDNANMRRREPALIIAFDNGSTINNMNKLVVIDYELFKDFLASEDGEI